MFRFYCFIEVFFKLKLQVRFKTLCVIETILRQTENEFFEAVVHFFEEDSSVIKDCLQSPQTSVKEKALKV